MHALSLTLALIVPPAQVPADVARAYADNLLQTVRQIQDRYARKLNRLDLLESGVAGLYEAAKRPVPAHLRAELEQADESELHRIIVKHRQAVGMPAVFREESRDLLVSLSALAQARLDPFSEVLRREDALRPSDVPQFGPGLVLDMPLRPAAQLPRLRRPGLVEETPLPPLPPLPPGDRPWKISTVYPGGPAQRVGLRPGDVIETVNEWPVPGAQLAKAHAALFPAEDGERGPAPVKIGYRRGTERREATFTPGAFHVETVFGVRRRTDHNWDYLLDPRDRIGYIRLGYIGNNTVEEFDAALEELANADISGLILDLRGCPGGFLRPAAAIPARFLGKGSIAIVKDRLGTVTDSFQADGQFPSPYTWPLLVLTGPETRGGGELIVAALQDHKRAKVAGQRTKGKASVSREPMPLPAPDYVMRLSTGTMNRPSGKNLQRYSESKPRDDWGIRPDQGLLLPVTPGLNQQIQAWYEELILRPGGSRTAVALDDPINDPLRAFGLQVLRPLIRAENALKDNPPGRSAGNFP